MRPKPVAEIIVKRTSAFSILHVYCASEDAKQWIKTNVNQYGFMIDLGSCISLTVSPLYDVRDIENYILEGYKA